MEEEIKSSAEPAAGKEPASPGLEPHRITSVQLVLFAILLSFIVSVATTILTVLYFSEALTGGRDFNVFRQILPVKEFATKETNEKIIRQDELVVIVVKKASPSVVSIVASKDVPIYERQYVNPFPDDPFFNNFFKDFETPQENQKGTQRQEVSAGTGFIISADGLILTNKHVVSDTAAEYTVFLNDGTKVPAKVLARDPFQDLAVVKIEKENLRVLPFADSSAVDIGQGVIAIGNALGEFRNTVSVGIVSGLGRTVAAKGGDIGIENLDELIQTDAAINPGNSGGPLLNLHGEVIGINTAMASDAQNIGFAIPVNKAKRDIENVKTHGRIIYPFIGIRYAIITKAMQDEKKLSVDYGAILVSGDGEAAVVTGSPAEKAGLKEGDIILMIDRQKIDQDHTVGSIVQEHSVGDMVILKILRDKKEMNIDITLAERKGQ